MRFLNEHFRLVVIVVVLFIITLVMSLSYFFAPVDFFLVKWIQKAASVIQEPVKKGGDGVADVSKGIFKFRSIVEENEELKEQVAALNKEVMASKLSQSELDELRNLSEVLKYTPNIPEYNYVSGEVIAQDGTSWTNSFTINIGANQGIKEDDIVINGDGLIGRVVGVGKDWAKVTTIIDSTISVSFRIARSLQYTGMLNGDGYGKLEGYLIDATADIVEGDTLITSGLGIYPQGIAIGKVKEIISDDDRLLKTIKIEPSVSLNTVRKVTVIIRGGTGEL